MKNSGASGVLAGRIFRDVRHVRLAAPFCLQPFAALLISICTLQAGLACAQQGAVTTAQEQGFRVNSVRVEGNTLLPRQTLDELVAGLPGPQRHLSDLRDAAARIQKAYRNAGYGGVVAFVPEQAASSGDFVIRVVEGKLAQVRVKGNRHFDAANIRAGLPNLREGSTPVVRAIDRDIQLSNENPAKALKVTLTAGGKPGEIDADIEVQDRQPVQYQLGYNNTGNHATGRHRVSVGIQNSNLTGRDDVLNVQYQTSPGHFDQVKVLGLGYRLPVYSRASSVDVFYAHSDVSNAITQTLAGPLAFTGKGDVLGVRGNLHFDRIGQYDHRLGLGVDWRDYENDCSYLNLGVLGSAACGPAAVSTTVVPLILSYTGQEQGTRGAWGVNASLFANVGGSSQATFEAARPGADRHFVKTRLAAFGNVPLPAGFAVQGNLEAQYTPQALISGEQFGIGGADSVRGYAERELAGDFGHAIRLELLGPALDREGLRLRPHLFVDQGRIARHKQAPCGGGIDTSCSISSVGLGVRLNFGKNATASLEWGRAGKDAVLTDSGDVRAHVSVQLAF